MKTGVSFLKIAALYFLIGVGMGLTMEIIQDHRLAGAHAHINLIGWVSMAIFGLIYILFPKAGESTLAKVHFWLYNISFPLFMLGLSFLLLGDSSLMILLRIFPNILVLSVLIFTINVFMNVRVDDVKKLLRQ
ncbi:cbb3-type cytochrome c oxidase subunit I [Robertmurraya andreesenii]|uniref:Heme/copper-type cytochrome/quinol oxidase subunit 1 n=1 Tax=Anoxybacillus andreesenii TaxID=1325932 RepID=A0ABT9V996_9BACL|nr:cbb3-type cytochrome c oxidase subunit I [Robertmurraya andreesenii]MDQ0157538.1 heme/copper-type cytochrome/quinol oxidase subunit 1 [Robertmurraya andreesenii]